MQLGMHVCRELCIDELHESRVPFFRAIGLALKDDSPNGLSLTGLKSKYQQRRALFNQTYRPQNAGTIVNLLVLKISEAEAKPPYLIKKPIKPGPSSSRFESR